MVPQRWGELKAPSWRHSGICGCARRRRYRRMRPRPVAVERYNRPTSSGGAWGCRSVPAARTASASNRCPKRVQNAKYSQRALSSEIAPIADVGRTCRHVREGTSWTPLLPQRSRCAPWPSRDGRQAVVCGPLLHARRASAGSPRERVACPKLWSGSSHPRTEPTVCSKQASPFGGSRPHFLGALTR
jgi:hypothetical protein